MSKLTSLDLACGHYAPHTSVTHQQGRALWWLQFVSHSEAWSYSLALPSSAFLVVLESLGAMKNHCPRVPGKLKQWNLQRMPCVAMDFAAPVQNVTAISLLLACDQWVWVMFA